MDKQKKKRNLIISVLFLFLLFVLTYFIIFKNIDFGSVFTSIRSVNAGYLLLAFCMVPAYFLLYGYFCYDTLRFKGCKIGLIKGIVYACTDFYFSAITPSATGGQPMVVYYMSKDKVPTSAATLSTVLLTVLFKVVLISLNLVALIFYFPVWYGAGPLFMVLWFFGVIACTGIIVLAMITMFYQRFTLAIGKKIINFCAKLRIIKNPEKAHESYYNFTAEYRQAAEDIKGHKLFLLKLYFVILFQRLAFFSVAYFIYRSFGYSEYSYFYFVAVQVFITQAVDSLPLPGGMGANEAAIIMMYKNTYSSDAEATGAMILIRFVNYYFVLLLSAVVVIANHIRHSMAVKKEV